MVPSLEYYLEGFLLHCKVPSSFLWNNIPSEGLSFSFICSMGTFSFKGLPFPSFMPLEHPLLKVCSTGTFLSILEGFIFSLFGITMPLACVLVNYPASTGPLEGFYLFSFIAHMLSFLKGFNLHARFLSIKELISNAKNLLALRGRVYYLSIKIVRPIGLSPVNP